MVEEAVPAQQGQDPANEAGGTSYSAARVGVANRTLVQSPNQILLPLLTDSWDLNSLLIRISIDLCFLQLQIS